MEPGNSTLESGFILVGILDGSSSPELLCATIAAMYMLAPISNGLLILAITLDVYLHVPMYLLLGQHSLMDLLLTSVISPKAVMDFLLRDNTITFGAVPFRCPWNWHWVVQRTSFWHLWLMTGMWPFVTH